MSNGESDGLSFKLSEFMIQHRRFAVVSAAFTTVSVITLPGLRPMHDSPRYLPPGTRINLFGLDPWETSVGATPLGWLTQVVYRVVPERGIPLVQAVLAAVAWSVLAFAVRLLVLRRARPAVVADLVAVLVFVAALSPGVASWDEAPMSESLTMTVLIAWLGVMILMAVVKSTSVLSACVVLMALTIASRPLLALVVIPPTALAFRWADRTHLALRPVLATATALSAVWALFISIDASRDPDLHSWQALTRLYFRQGVPGHTEFFVDEGLPACEPLATALAGSWDDVYRFRESMDELCPETATWLRSEAPSGPKFVLTHPGSTLETLAEESRSLLSVPLGPDVRSRLEHPFDSILVPSDQVDLEGSLWRGFPVWLMLGIAISVGVPRSGSVFPHEVALATVLVGVGSVAYIVVAWSADGMEISRHAYPGSVLCALTGLPLGLSVPRPQLRRIVTQAARLTGSQERAKDVGSLSESVTSPGSAR